MALLYLFTLRTQMKVIVHHEPNAEDNAMLQALYSRSSKSVTEHLDKLKATGSGKFMEQYYIGYGHASVGDLGTTTVYFEGVSMLAAKALQDNQLYNGQECSSRYIDFSNVEFRGGHIAPDGVVASMQEKLRAFYVKYMEPTKDWLKVKHPRLDGENEDKYNKAIAARAFDVMRGFLPCGATTNVAWMGTLRNMKERLELLMHHPLHEVSTTASWAYRELHSKYPHSFEIGYVDATGSIVERYFREDLRAYEGNELYEHLSRHDQFYSEVRTKRDDDTESDAYIMAIEASTEAHIDGLADSPADMWATATGHPKGYRPPRHSGAEYGQVDAWGLLDFGSFRDLQRHRGGYCSMPCVDPLDGFHSWYLTNLPIEAVVDAGALLDEIKALDSKLIAANPTAEQRIANQYFMPMGCLVQFNLKYSVSQAVYVAELRSGQTVHPTLRPIAQSMAKYLTDFGVVVRYDDRPDVWSTRRGGQDITVLPVL